MRLVRVSCRIFIGGGGGGGAVQSVKLKIICGLKMSKHPAFSVNKGRTFYIALYILCI